MLKEKTTKQLILVFPYFNKPFQVKCDASGETIIIVLSQEEKPITYFSEKLNEAWNKYSPYDKDLYIVVQELNKWRHYLMSKEFIMYSVNHALQYIMQLRNLNHRRVK